MHFYRSLTDKRVVVLLCTCSHEGSLYMVPYDANRSSVTLHTGDPIETDNSALTNFKIIKSTPRQPSQLSDEDQREISELLRVFNSSMGKNFRHRFKYSLNHGTCDPFQFFRFVGLKPSDQIRTGCMFNK